MPLSAHVRRANASDMRRERARRALAPLALTALAALALGSPLACGAGQQARPEGPSHDPRGHALRGHATWYGARHHGRRTACGEPFDMEAWTAAHRTLPFHTVVRVIDPQTRRSVVVRINDRGPYGRGKIIDLSRAAAHDLGMIRQGVLFVELDVVQWGDGSRCR